jgi:hypothetical protein
MEGNEPVSEAEVSVDNEGNIRSQHENTEESSE